ncbi:MAG: hypothetical protein H3C34_14785 [Caldilineaceae bacterium]|nr:hypothetical protein [Caldilineaceae bacterium]
MRILNFSHPLTPKQSEQIEAAVGTPIIESIPVKAQFDVEADFVPQVVGLIESLNISTDRWQGEPWLLVLPSLNFAAAILLAELHGRMGHFPAFVRLKPVQGALVTEYVVAEIVNLEHVRAAARTRR